MNSYICNRCNGKGRVKVGLSFISSDGTNYHDVFCPKCCGDGCFGVFEEETQSTTVLQNAGGVTVQSKPGNLWQPGEQTSELEKLRRLRWVVTDWAREKFVQCEVVDGVNVETAEFKAVKDCILGFDPHCLDDDTPGEEKP